MKITIFTALGISALAVAITVANGKEPERISRDDCHATFLVPNGLEYVEINGAKISGNNECYIAFRYTGDLKIKRRPNPPSTADDWRWLTDFVLAVKGKSLGDSLAQIKTSEGLERPGMFNLVSNEHFQIPGGEVYVLRYSALKPTKNMLRLNETEETIFAAGNDSRSVSYIQYTGARMTKNDKAALYRSLFLSFSFESSTTTP
ncbi:hypothetical protein PXJ20_01575 [Paraburkholderia sp. A1RI_3L]|uniref:hypothetical protein n=1 Tax=Paraburkholderia TaxID=1822464 RepID=UPI002407CCC1|nr:hypothetical protein [Paraburkholderia sp. SUR17]WEY38616.1 hypothetical protein P2869_16540 [Paraburkholderia sp. SUR17]